MIRLLSDTTIKYMMKEEKGKLWFSEVIKELIGIDLMDYELYSENYTTGENKRHDFYSDVVLKYSEDIVIIEVQNKKHGSEKNYWYLYRVSGYNVERAKSYKNKTTLICFNNYYPNEEIKEKKAKVVKAQMMSPEYDYVRQEIEVYEIILPNFKEKSYTKIDKKMQLLRSETMEEMEANKTDELDEWVIAKLKQLGGSENFMFEYDRELHEEIMKNTMRKEGVQETKREMILKLNELGVSLEIIAKSANMSTDEVTKIINESN